MSEAAGVVVRPEHMIREVWSVAYANREGLRTLRGLIERGEIKHVFTYKPDRLYRDPLEGGIFMRFCRRHGVTLHFGDGTTADSVIDELIQYVIGFVGMRERDNTSGRSYDGNLKAARANRMPNGTGVGMYGYDVDPVTRKRRINEGEAEVVRLAFDLKLAGYSNSKIARTLNEMGIPSKKFGKWSAGTIGTMLRNEAYTGVQFWGKNRYELVFDDESGGEGDGRKKKRRKVTPKPREEWIVIEGLSPMIIEPAVFRAVQEAMERSPRRGKHWDYIFTDYFSCGLCSSTVCGATQLEGVHRNATYPYYRCRGTQADVSSANGRPKICSVASVRADLLEAVVREHILAVVREPKVIVEDLRRNSSDGVGELDRRIADLQGRVNKIRGELATLTMQRAKEFIDQEM